MLDNLLDDSAEFETFQTQHYWDIISEKEAAGEEFIDIEDMYGYRPVSLERAVKCPHCGHEENVDLEDFMYDESSYEKRKMVWDRILCTALILKIVMNVRNVGTH